MLSQILTTISSCKSLSSEIQIDPELFYTSDILLPEIKNRLLKLCKMEKAEIKDIIFSVFRTATFEGKKYVKPQGSFSYFSVNHLLVSKKASQIEVKMGKKGVTNKNELQMYFQNKEVTNTFLQEILNSIKNGGSVFTGELRDGLEKVFDLKFYEAIKDSSDGNAIKDAVINGTGLKELFKELIYKGMNDRYQSVRVGIRTNDESEAVDIKPRVMEILNEFIDSGELMILELFEVQHNFLKFEKNAKDKINIKIINKLSSEFPLYVDSNIYLGTWNHPNENDKKVGIIGLYKFKKLTIFGDIIDRLDFKGDFTVFFLQTKEITEFAEDFKKLYEHVRTCENIELTKKNIEEYENILKSLKKDTETTILIENHINHIKALIKHSSEQNRIFNILNDESIAFNFKIVFKDLNEKIQSVVSKYYTIKEEELHVIEEFIQTPTPTSTPPTPDEPVKIKYTGILTKPWFYISLLVAFVVVRVLLMYFMSRGRYSVP